MKHLHHIVPKHMGGTDDSDNLVELTVEEHADAHRKLYEEHGKQEDYFAWQGLSGIIGKEEIITEINRQNGRNCAAKRNNGYQRKPEIRAKISASLTGKVQSEETIAKRVSKLKGQKRTPEQRARMSAAMKGKKKSPEHVERMRQTMRDKWANGDYANRGKT